MRSYKRFVTFKKDAQKFAVVSSLGLRPYGLFAPTTSFRFAIMVYTRFSIVDRKPPVSFPVNGLLKRKSGDSIFKKASGLLQMSSKMKTYFAKTSKEMLP